MIANMHSLQMAVKKHLTSLKTSKEAKQAIEEWRAEHPTEAKVKHLSSELSELSFADFGFCSKHMHHNVECTFHFL